MTTIFAQSSAYGKAGVAVFRISGKDALRALKMLTEKDVFQPRKTYFSKIINPFNGKTIDEGIVVYFQAPSSFTGEDVVELYLHGSVAVSRIILDVLSKLDFLQLALPGEFSKRAFIGGKMDLTSAEGIADLIDAETALQHEQALQQMTGKLGAMYEEWRAKLLKISAYLEAFIDFPDEEIPAEILDDVTHNIVHLKSALKIHLSDNKRGEKLRSGINMAIFGPPNVGKSSLMNYLASRDVAIVSAIAGTTRDFIETFLDIGGYPISLVDTAGIRADAQDMIEQEGIKRAVDKACDADIKMLVLDVATSFDALEGPIKNLVDSRTIIVVNKTDLEPEVSQIDNAIYISLKDKLNLEQLLSRIIQCASEVAGPSEHPSITRARYRQNIELALQNLENFSLSKDLVLATEDIRQAARLLSFITGKVTVEEILGEIFSSFCIGK